MHVLLVVFSYCSAPLSRHSLERRRIINLIIIHNIEAIKDHNNVMITIIITMCPLTRVRSRTILW